MDKKIKNFLALGLFFFSLSFLTSAQATVEFYGNSTHEEVEGIHLIHTQGNDYTVAYDTTWLLADESAEGMIPYMGNYITRMLQNAISKDIPSFIIGFISDILFHWPIFENLKGREKSMLAGIYYGMNDAGHNISFDMVRRAYVSPEVTHLVITKAVDWGVVPGIIDTRQFGCSSVIVLPEVSGSEKTYFSRGMDYPGLGRFDKNPVVNMIDPEDGYRYVTVNSAGLASLPLTAINQHGLALALHVSMTADVDNSGSVVFHVLEQIIRHAKTIDEAFAIVNGLKHVSGWLIHLTDIYEGERRSAVIELSGQQQTLLWREGSSSLTNAYASPEQQARELYMGKTTHNHNVNRAQRLKDLIQQYEGQFTVETGVKILRDNYDVAVGRWVSYSPNIVATVDQVKAIVMELDSDVASSTLWVANGLAPASQGTFIPLNIGSFLAYGEMATVGEDRIEAQPRTDEEEGTGYVGFRGYDDYKKAYMALEYDDDPKNALRYIWSAAMKDRSDYYRLAAALLYFKYDEIMDAMQLFFWLIHSTKLDEHHRNIAKLYAAMTFDVLRDREEAVDRYRELIRDEKVDPIIKRSARYRLKNRFTKADARNISPDLKWFDIFGYGGFE